MNATNLTTTLIVLMFLVACSPGSSIVLLINKSYDAGEQQAAMRERRNTEATPCGDDDNPCTVGKPRINSMTVNTTIFTRYASTTVMTEVINEAETSQDTNFRFSLSKNAFISDFFMEVGGRIYQSEVKEKEEAQKAFDEAKSRNQTAAQVKLEGDDFTKFETEISLSADTTATFHLTFQELLRREKGSYKHKVNLFPREIVPQLRADVYINEPQGIKFADVSWNQEGGLPTQFLERALTVEREFGTAVTASLQPSVADQEALSGEGIKGDLLVTYDVTHDVDAGNIEVLNNYFVHHISPVNLEATRKSVVFVIDVSGSMGERAGDREEYGTKLSQTKIAMSTIINDIRPFDTFNILSFSSDVNSWQRGLVTASDRNKRSAQLFVEQLTARGGTNMKLGLDEAISRLNAVNSVGLPILIILTDGQPSSGVTNKEQIVRETTAAIDGTIALFGLAFGEDADFDLLEKLSGFNQGLARQIHSSSTPSDQLEGFYTEIATPLLYNVGISYSEGAVELETLTQHNFISYFEGTEMVVAGKLKEGFQGTQLMTVVSGEARDGAVEYELTKDVETAPDDSSRHVEDFAERLWAYLTVQDLLLRYRIALTDAEKEEIREEATRIALEYKFVTPLTSLIVIKPEDNQNKDDFLSFDGGPEKDYENDMYNTYNAGGGVVRNGGGSGGNGGDRSRGGYGGNGVIHSVSLWLTVVLVFVACLQLLA